MSGDGDLRWCRDAQPTKRALPTTRIVPIPTARIPMWVALVVSSFVERLWYRKNHPWEQDGNWKP
jgi:hypothetical protein